MGSGRSQFDLKTAPAQRWERGMVLIVLTIFLTARGASGAQAGPRAHTEFCRLRETVLSTAHRPP